MLEKAKTMNEELKDFLKDIPSDEQRVNDLLTGDPENPAEEAAAKETSEKEDEPYKNRRHRRLESQLQQEREARIRAEALAQGRSETQKFAQEAGVDERLFKIFTNDDVGKSGAATLAEMLKEVEARAEANALTKLKQEQEQSVKEQQQFEKVIETELEAIEDEHNVDLTSDAPAARKMRREFLEKVQKLSPKDSEGTITSYADFGAVWEEFQESRKKPDNSRQKDLASRSMTPSGPVDNTKAAEDAQLNWLRRNGIRV